ncbi:hypothetical protein [Synechococcus sp. CS-1328]|uniref:hypothetical protein n=1 Tax=Synechococcus sp. CS-1328 TaxID=2847976 RepID=UPI00223C0B7D|nr:hypothetical protein [Synechococcus sp. CS-1328]MCT0225834.1 hypothetical protein [Synechococcus sp. CS-1328]
MREILLGLCAVVVASPVVAECRDDGKPFAGESPPSGSLLAKCWQGSADDLCGVKISDSPGQKMIEVWHPARVQSAITIVYTGPSFKPGSVWEGNWDEETVVKTYRRMKSFDGKTLIWEVRRSNQEKWTEEVEFVIF